MRLSSLVVVVLLGVVLLTWLLLRGMGDDGTRYEHAQQVFSKFALAEASLQRDVLQARAGLLQDDDPLDRAETAMENAISQLRSIAPSGGLNGGPVDRLASTVVEQEELTERFKSGNALLQNSLSYVGLLGTDPMFVDQDTQLSRAAGALAAAILHLTRDNSPETVKALDGRIERFAAQAPTVGPDAEAAQALLAHARLLFHLLPEVDRTLEALVTAPSGQFLDASRALFASRQAAVEATARRFRLLLYLASLLLLVALIRLGYLLRARALALRARAAFEHLIAQNSTRLINCPPGETSARLHQVLRELGEQIGMDRAYVVMGENPIDVHAWSAAKVPYPPGWPDRALALSTQIDPAGLDIVAVRDTADLPPGEVKDALAAVGVRGWACVPLVRPGRVRGILGFDTVRPAWKVVFPFPVVRLAGDAVASAIEREALERDRAKLARRLERARRMQIIGSLASGIAHNFNNIIAAIVGYSEMAEAEITPGTRPAQYIDEVRQAAERGRELIDKILTFGRRSDAPAQLLSVRFLFEKSAALLRPLLPAAVELVIEDVANDVVLSGEPAQLQQVILNLCRNAAQAIPESGWIRVTAQQTDIATPRPISHGVLAPGRYVCLAVTDSGRGFDASVAQRLFEPFFTTRSAGTGLGLATVHEIVREHDGALNVESSPGHGSRFEVWLPAAPTGSTAMTQPVSQPLGQGEAVLVVESDRERLLQDEDMMAALGYEPVGFGLAADAITACRSAPDRFDAIVISCASANPTPLGLARALHELVPRQPILLATADTGDVSTGALADAGVAEILRRPLVSGEVAAALARCLRSTREAGGVT
jgi:signal transduction histidine kinase